MPIPLPVPLADSLPPRVAVLDDDQVFLTLLRDVLTEAGYEACTLRPGIGGHEVLRTLAPAAIILDLPDDAGVLAWRLLALCARDAHLRHIPLLVCVPDDGHASDRASALHHPRSTLVCKPFTLDALLTSLERLQGQHAGAHSAHAT
jgi:DNA-binding response OmpR family regulator